MGTFRILVKELCIKEKKEQLIQLMKEKLFPYLTEQWIFAMALLSLLSYS